ncbi:MAG: hypothetical protein AAGC53_05270 [Actinomycetota bacterium]
MTAHSNRRSTLRTWAFSTGNHPINQITDPKILARYQSSRVLIALLGGLTGTVGLTISLSNSGDLDLGTELSGIGLMGVIGMVVAVILVLYPWSNVARWLATVSLLLVPVLLLDVPFGWRVTLGAVGAGVSIIVARLVFVLTRAAAHLSKLTKAAAATTAIIAAFVIVGDTAHAQVISCANTELTLREADGGGAQTWNGENGDAVLSIDLTEETKRYLIEAESGIAAGSIVVELVHTQPIPILTPGDAITVWTGDLLPEGDGSRLEPTAVTFRRDPQAGLRFIAPRTNVDLQIAAGEGLYRATVTDAITGDVCALDLRIRILGDPLDRPNGGLLVSGLAALLGAVAGVANGADPRRLWKGRWPWPPSGHPTVDPGNDPVVPPQADSTVTSAVLADWTRVRLTFRLGEEEVEPSELTLTDASFRKMVTFGASAKVNGRWVVPIEFRRDPRRVRLDVEQLLTIGVLAGGEGWATFTLGNDSIKATGPFELVTVTSTTTDEESDEAVEVEQ